MNMKRKKGKTMNDLISRARAIDALRGYLVEKRCPDDGMLTCRLIENEVINKLPPIQLDNNSEVPNSSDCISRQAAVDELVKMLGYCFQADEEVIDAVVTTINELPPSQLSTNLAEVGTDAISRQAAT